MSGTPRKPKIVPAPLAAAPAVPPSPGRGVPTPDSVMGLFDPAALSEMMIEGFARAFERKFQGASMDHLLDAIQLAADLRVFKEGLFLTAEQVCRLLDISMRTFDQYKRDGKIEVDPHVGPGCLRYTLSSVLQTREKFVRESRAGRS